MFHYRTVFTMINLAIALFLLFPGVAFSISHQNLSANYDFSVTLKEDKFWLYWSFNKTTQNISFAVRANTTGWVGFALSPDGHMPGSDIVMGWIDNSGMHHFYVRSLSVKMYFLHVWLRTIAYPLILYSM